MFGWNKVASAEFTIKKPNSAKEFRRVAHVAWNKILDDCDHNTYPLTSEITFEELATFPQMWVLALVFPHAKPYTRKKHHGNKMCSRDVNLTFASCRRF
jgi:hypothetical protein